jgi:hypothetical protein
MPLRLRHEYAAGIPRGLPTGDINREGVPCTRVQVRAATQPSVRL